MNELASLLLAAIKGSIQQELDETGQVNPRLLAEAVKWLSQSGVTLSPDNPDVADFSGLAKTLEGLMSEKEGHSYL